MILKIDSTEGEIKVTLFDKDNKKDELKIKRNITTSALSAFFPFTSSFFKFDDTGVWLGSNKNGIPIIT